MPPAFSRRCVRRQFVHGVGLATFTQTMNTCCPISPVPTPVAPARQPFALLQKFLNTAVFAPVDLTDTIYASLPNRVDVAEDCVSPLPLENRPECHRLMSWRLP